MSRTPEDTQFTHAKREELLRKQLLNFSIAHEMSNVIGSARDIQGVCQSLSLGLRDMMDFKKSAIFKIHPQNFQLAPFFSQGTDSNDFNKLSPGLSFLDGQYTDAIFLNRHIIVDEIEPGDPFRQISGQSYAVFPIVARVFQANGDVVKCHNTECLCQDAQNPAWWADAEYVQSFSGLTEDEFRAQALKCDAFKCFGVLWLDLSDRAQITSDEVTVINSVLVQTGLIVENFESQRKLHNSFLALEEANKSLEKKNTENLIELNRAHKIQNALLPDVFPERAIKDVASFYVPASKVGGDYFDCFEIDESRTAILVADVSGHGVAAGLIMSMFKVLIKTFSKGLATPAEILTRINQLLIEDVNSDHFVTCFFSIFHEDTRELVYCNAGHNPIIMQTSSNEQSNLESTNIFVGAIDEIQAEDRSVTIEKGTRLTLYTDGVTETMDPAGTQWEFENFLSCCMDHRHLNCQDLLQEVLQEVDEHRKGQAFADDLTLMIIDL